jgi:hypothetical protein
MPHPSPAYLYLPLCTKGLKKVGSSEVTSSPVHQSIRPVASGKYRQTPSLTNFIAPQSTQICAVSFRQPMLPVRQFLWEQRASGLKGILTVLFSPEQHGLEGQKALVACFVRLFAAM